jgi:hypothetical protein
MWRMLLSPPRRNPERPNRGQGGAVGLDTSGSSVPYVAGWGEVGELDAIRGYAETIDQIARRIEESIREESHDPTAQGLPGGVAIQCSVPEVACCRRSRY